MLNPLYVLADLLKHQPVSNIIDCADTMLKIRFEDWCISAAKDDVDLTIVREQAAKAFDWWNMLPTHWIAIDDAS